MQEARLTGRQGIQTESELKRREEHENTQALTGRVTGFGGIRCTIKNFFFFKEKKDTGWCRSALRQLKRTTATA